MVVYCSKIREVTYGYANNFLVVAERMDKVYYVFAKLIQRDDPGPRHENYSLWNTISGS